MNKILGITDEVTSCSCCGREELKRTVLVEFADGSSNYYGTTCASRALGWSTSEVSRGITAAKTAQIEADRIARDQAHRARIAAMIADGTACEHGVTLKFAHCCGH